MSNTEEFKAIFEPDRGSFSIEKLCNKRVKQIQQRTIAVSHHRGRAVQQHSPKSSWMLWSLFYPDSIQSLLPTMANTAVSSLWHPWHGSELRGNIYLSLPVGLYPCFPPFFFQEVKDVVKISFPISMLRICSTNLLGREVCRFLGVVPTSTKTSGQFSSSPSNLLTAKALP